MQKKKLLVRAKWMTFPPVKVARKVYVIKRVIAEAAKELVDPFTESDIENDPDLVDSDKEDEELIFSKNKKTSTSSCVHFI